jgi:serine phosphatase RsbU (regulator of sigma subunit)
MTAGRIRERLSTTLSGLRPRRSLVALLALLVALLVADELTAPSIRLGPLMVAVPALAAVFCGPAGVLLVTVVTLGCVITAAAANLQLDAVNFSVQLATMLLISAAAVGAAVMRQRRERQLSQARWVAKVAQRVLLRPLPRRTNSLMISSMYLAIEEEAEIGGDLYAAVSIGRTTRILIGDAQGKGLDAVEEASSVLRAFRQAARHRTPLSDLAPYLERSLGEDIKEAAEADSRDRGDSHSTPPRLQEYFVTAVMVDVPEESHQIHIVNRGHSPPLLIHQGKVLSLEPAVPALPLGLGNLDKATPSIDMVDFEDGDTLLLYTDGLIEARDVVGAFYPLAERLRDWTRYAPNELLQAIHTDLLHHVHDRLVDDVAMVAIQRTARPATPGAPLSPAVFPAAPAHGPTTALLCEPPRVRGRGSSSSSPCAFTYVPKASAPKQSSPGSGTRMTTSTAAAVTAS